MEWVQTSGKTIDEAKERALDELGVDDRDAEFEVLEEPRSGLFGLTRGDAKVRGPGPADLAAAQAGAGSPSIGRRRPRAQPFGRRQRRRPLPQQPGRRQRNGGGRSRGEASDRDKDRDQDASRTTTAIAAVRAAATAAAAAAAGPEATTGVAETGPLGTRAAVSGPVTTIDPRKTKVNR